MPEKKEGHMSEAGYNKLSDIPGLTEEKAKQLRQAGYHTPDDIKQAERDELAAIDGISFPLASYLTSVVNRIDDIECTEEPPATTANERTEPVEHPRELPSDNSRIEYTPRFAGFILFIGIFLAVSVVLLDPVMVALSTVFVVFLASAYIGLPPGPNESIAASYTVHPERPRPGETVTVQVAVENKSKQTLADIRLIDTIPDKLRVVGGTPRKAVGLKPGEETTVEYEVIATHGEYEFGPPVVRIRTLVGTIWHQEPLEDVEYASFRCAVTADDIPLENDATAFIGDVLSNSGGDGIEFYATREYLRGDPPSRINWRELAKRGELSTVTYRQRKAESVTVLLDVRAVTRTAAAPGEPGGELLSAYAAYQLSRALMQRNHLVGVAALGLSPTVERKTTPLPCRSIKHGRSRTQHKLIFELFQTVAGGLKQEKSLSHAIETGWNLTVDETVAVDTRLDDTNRTTIGEFVHRLAGWTDAGTTMVCLSPLVDDKIVECVQEIDRRAYNLLVISPDITTPIAADADEIENIGSRLNRVERAVRVERLRRRGITVVDWPPHRTLTECLTEQTA